MKDRKRRLELYSFYDHTGIERHLERMAEKGWLLEQVENNIWRYRRTEPCKLTFFVTYFPRASELDPEPSEEQELFYDYCGHTGWKLAASSAQLQIFYNENPEPVPIATDPRIELETVHRSARRSFLPSLWVLLVLGLLMVAFSVAGFLRDPIGQPENPTMVFTAFCYFLLILYCSSELAGYYSWYFRARKAAARGQFLETKSRVWMAKLILAAVFLGFLYWILNRLSTGPIWQRWVGVVTACGIIAILSLGGWLKILLKKRKLPPGLNRTVTFVVIFGLCLAFMALMVRVGLEMAQKEFNREAQSTSVEESGESG